VTAPGITPESNLRCPACALVETAVRDRIVARDVTEVRTCAAEVPYYTAAGRDYVTREEAEAVALRAAADETAVALCPSCLADVDEALAGRVAV